MGKKVHKAIERHKVESLARNWSLTALKTLGGIMSNPNSKDCDRIRAAEIVRDWAWGRSGFEARSEGRLRQISLEVVHLAPKPREEIEQEPLIVEWKDITQTNGHDRP
jgi:hypothetical protein